MTNLTEKQENSLILFMQLLRGLLESSVVQSKTKSLTAMAEAVLTSKSEITVLFEGYEEEQFLAFFVSLRQFTMEKEQAVYFKDVCKIILDNCSRAELKAWVDFAIRKWDAIMNSQPVVGFNFDGVALTNEKLLKLWLYSGRFHTDTKKTNQWNALPEMQKADVTLSVQALAPKLVNCLVIVGSVIRWWLEATTESVPPAPTP